MSRSTVAREFEDYHPRGCEVCSTVLAVASVAVDVSHASAGWDAPALDGNGDRFEFMLDRGAKRLHRDPVPPDRSRRRVEQKVTGSVTGPVVQAGHVTGGLYFA